MGELEKRVDELEDSLSEISVPEDIEERINFLEKQISKVGKEAVRIVKAKEMPDKKATSIAGDITQIERRVDLLESSDKPSGALPPSFERRLDALEEKLNSANSRIKSFVGMVKENEGFMASLDSRLQSFVGRGEIAELSRTVSEKLDEFSSLKAEMERALSKLEKSDSPEAAKLKKWMREAESSFATREQVDGMLEGFSRKIDEKLNSVDGLREKVLMVAGLSLEQQEKFKELKTSSLSMASKRVEQSEAAWAKQFEQLKSKVDSIAASTSASLDSIKSKVESDVSALGESISNAEEFENRINSEVEALKESVVSKHEIENLKELLDSYNARISTIKQVVASHSKSIDEMSQLKAQIQSEHESALDDYSSHINEAMQEIRSQANNIVSEMERKMNDLISMGMRNVDEAKSRMEGEMKLVLDRISKSESFEKGVSSELSSIRSEMGTIDERVGRAIDESKGELENEMRSELARLQRITGDAEKRLGIMKSSWDKAIKESIRKSSDEFGRIMEAYGESLEKLKNADSVIKSSLEANSKEINRKISEDIKANSSMRKDMESALKESRITNRDSQEKLSMVKEFISGLESRLNSEIDDLNKKIDRISKVQQKLELESISPGRKGR
jgi:chromosome segregation ATPase